jgi:hypothetical protein
VWAGARRTGRDMWRTTIRWSGYILLAVAMGLGILDGARLIAAPGMDATSIGDAVLWLMPREFALIEPFVSQSLHPLLWDPLLKSLLSWPAMPVLFVAGGLFLVLGRPSAPAAIATA